jgi:hypothetical protein
LLISLPARGQPAPPAAPARAPDATVVPPQLRVEKSVTYPEGAHGDVTVPLVLVVGPDGRVRSAEPSADAPEPFASHAARAVLDFEFEPATRAGEPVAAKIRLELHFT